MSEVQDPCDILIVDDEESMREFLEIVLVNEGLNVAVARTGEEAVQLIESRSPSVFIQDLRMGGLDGMNLLEKAKSLAPDMPVIVITAYSSWNTAVDAMRLGAFDYLKKPFDTDHIRSVIQRALLVTRDPGTAEIASRLIIGNSGPMQKVFDLVKRVAPTDSTVLIRGESGSGKELVARSIHGTSHRRDQAFVAVNCSAFSESLLESELFGHARGAFTGAVEERKGLFESAHGGTLFLDEVADMSPSTQVKILRSLEERRVMPVGSVVEVPVDVRIIAATNRNLEEDIRDGRFREDLFYRLNVIPLVLPPLRERVEDIPLLAGHFLRRYANAMGRDVRGLSEGARVALVGYRWPGNVRELDNVMQRHVALCEGNTIEQIALGSGSMVSGGDLTVGSHTQGTGNHGAEGDGRAHEFEIPPSGIDLDDVMEEIERRYLLRALEQSDGNLTKAAKILGLSYRSIRYKVKKLGVRDLLSGP